MNSVSRSNQSTAFDSKHDGAFEMNNDQIKATQHRRQTINVENKHKISSTFVFTPNKVNDKNLWQI